MTEIIDVDFAPKDASVEPEMRVVKRSHAGCRHQSTLINEVLRRVSCKDCGEALDPIEVLLYWAHDWNRYADWVKSLRAEKLRREREIEELKRQRKNIKAQIRRDAKKAKGRPILYPCDTPNPPQTGDEAPND